MDTLKLRNTNLTVKKEQFSNFFGKIEEQLTYGGTKYANFNPLFPDKEATDFIVDCYPEFVESTMMKYLLRFKMQKREEDLFKIATYAYILWLKYFTGESREENIKYSLDKRKK
jgi:predicted translin family RNA/ssDNA-binding protein